MLGYPPSLAEKESEAEGWMRYLSLCTDHKVVGIQYIVGIGVFFLFGGFQTGWTGYAPLSDQGTAGYDAYIGFFALVGLSMTLLGFNLLVTIITMRAPGMTWSRLPIFVWSVLATAALMMLAAPMLIATLAMAAMDRTAQTVFFLPSMGGSPYLYQNLFWVFGHPEVYIVA